MSASDKNWAMLCLSPAKGGLEMLAVETVLNITPFSFAIVLDNSWISTALKASSTTVFHQDKPSKVPMISAFNIAKWIMKNNITLLHIHWTKDLLLAVIIKKILATKGYKLKLAVSRHMSLTRQKKDIYHNWLYRAIDAYISVCDFVHNQALQRLPIDKNKLHRVYPGVSDVAQEQAPPFQMDSDKTHILVLGRLEPMKGQHLMLQALATLNNSTLHCHFVGHAMDDDYLEEITNQAKELDVYEQVTFHGFMNTPSRYLSHFDGLVLTTYCETFGLVLIEAMRAGIFTIGSSCGGVLEIIEHKKTGLLFESKNTEDLAKQLQWLIEHEEEAKLIALAGQEKTKHYFDKQKNYRQLQYVLDNII